ncbi:hypothetical protein [Halorhodospira halophila]|uniref:hypothetical protein n=1 Tax=Halorhodospira halophila TaxID=1053 RepID=UPI001911D57A|nr:hypothetical protein [Halorhodospira halophila]MBK5944847.1 hypothetical protein [Halorhodospira halophila]
MELIMFVALIFMLWLLVQLGVGIYHQGLRRGLRRWVRGLPHLVSVALVSMLKVIPMLVAGAVEASRARGGAPAEHTQSMPLPSEEFGEIDSRHMTNYINYGQPIPPPEEREYMDRWH